MKNLRKILMLFLILFLTVPWLINFSPVVPGSAAASTPGMQRPLDISDFFFPFVMMNKPHPPFLLGIYPQGPLGQNDRAYIDAQLHNADTWAGKGHSLVGVFIDLEATNLEYNVTGMLDMLWTNGYTAFVNLNSTRTAAYIAGGSMDTKIRAFGTAYANFVNLGGGRKAFLGPLPEMNGSWPSYGLDIANYKLAYDRIRSLFAQQGAPTSSAWWAFVPNGYSATKAHNFENYYPGDDKVDAIGFSSYNYGWCPAAAPYQKWEDYTTLYTPYIDRMRTMAPSKPIIIAQTGSSAKYPNGNTIDHAKKDQWLIDQYTYLATRYGVMAIIYYDLDISWECDWAIYNVGAGEPTFDGYKTAVANPAFIYVSPANLSSMNLTVP
jgi:hypothetical protein